LVANHLIWLILEGAAGYVERIRDTQDADKQAEDEQKAMETT